MSVTVTTDYGKVFNSLCHFMALSQTVDTKTVLDNLVVSAIALDKQVKAISFSDIQDAVKVYFSTEITGQDLRKSIERLISNNKLIVEPNDTFRLPYKVVAEVNTRVQTSKSLEEQVKQEWLGEVAKIDDKRLVDQSHDLTSLWVILQKYLAKSFYRHGAQTTQILDPTLDIGEKSTVNLSTLLQEAITESDTSLPHSFIKESIHGFLGNQTPDRVAYLAELLDGTFTFFALNVDEAISNYLTGAFQPLKIFLDTNFIFGILHL
ncbi:hypothetical protein KJ885_06335, partial [Patescibacteria group bacterium]|nr:hypothetical protein [Patescibacteria group bacterium]